MQYYSVTVSRAHKLVDRLNEMFKSLSQTSFETRIMKSQLTHKSISAYEQQTGKLIDNLAKLETVIQTIQEIKIAIGSYNETSGINKLMTEKALIDRYLAVYSKYENETFNSGYLPAELNALIGVQYTRETDGAIEIQLIPDDTAKCLRETIKQKRKQTIKISDEIAGLNAAKISIKVADWIADEIFG